MDYEDKMKFTDEMFSYLIEKLFGTLKIEMKNRNGKLQKVDFKPPWPKITFREVIKKDCGIDINKLETVEKLQAEIKKKKMTYPSVAGMKESKKRASELFDTAIDSLEMFGDRAQHLKDLAMYIIARTF